MTEVTEGNSLNNGAKKVYKVKLADGAGKVVNVGFLDNVNVTPDKANKGVTVTDATGKDLGYPGQFTTSSVDTTNNKQVQIKLDNKGEATFTLTGSSETVTPFVWVDTKGVNNTDPTVGRFDKTELAAFAAPVTFGKVQNMGLTVTSSGTSNAAAFKVGADAAVRAKLGTQSAYTYTNDVDASNKITKTAAAKLADDLENTGGRDYKAVLKDLNGKLAPSGTEVKVSVATGSALTTTGPVYLVDNNTSTVYRLDNSKSTQEFTLKTDSKGEVSFTLFGAKDSYATPTVFVETGKGAGLDKDDLQQVGEIVYFGDAVLTTAKLTVNGKEETNAAVSGRAAFTYQSVDQNGKHYFENNFVVTFQVETTFSGATVFDAQGNVLGTVNQGSMGSGKFVVPTTNGKATIYVEAGNGTTVNVNASASQATFPDLKASVTFNKVTNEGIAPGQQVHGKVVAVDEVNNRILLSNSTGTTIYELSYADADLYIKGVQHLESTFEGSIRDGVTPGTAGLSVGDELVFTQATDTTKAKFDNKDVDITTTLTIAPNAKVVLAFENSVYDFAGQTLGLATNANPALVKAAKVEIQGNNVTLKNLILEGNLEVTNKVTTDASLDNVTVTGTTTINGGDGDTFNAKGSTLNLVVLGIKEHLALDNTNIRELVTKVTGSSVTGTGNITSVTVASGTAPSVTGVVAPTPVAEVPFTATSTTADSVTLTFTANVIDAPSVTVTGGTTAVVGTVTTSGDVATLKFTPALTSGQVITFVNGGKTYTATYAGNGTLTFTRKY